MTKYFKIALKSDSNESLFTVKTQIIELVDQVEQLQYGYQ